MTPWIVGTLLLGVLAGLAAIGITHAIRKLAPVERLLVPPLGCDTCCAFQASIVTAGVVCAVFLTPDPAAIALAALRTVLATGVGTGLAVFGLKAAARLRDDLPSPTDWAVPPVDAQVEAQVAGYAPVVAAPGLHAAGGRP